MIGDLQSKFVFVEMLDGESSTHFFDQPPQQCQQIVLWMADHLELVAIRVSVAKLNGIQSDPRSKQTGAKMELMGFPRV